MHLTPRQARLKGDTIDPQTGCRGQTDLLAVDQEMSTAKQAVEPRKFTPEVGARHGLGVFRPEQCGKAIPTVALARDSQIGGQRPYLTPAHFDELVVPLQAR
jgi:hypothetical protein